MNLLKLLGCFPKEPDAKCNNCRRNGLTEHAYVICQNSKDKSCIYVPISLQVKT
jgi:hypothetical protein